MSDDCPFCKRIAAGEFDYEDSDAVAFEPLNPVTPGHFLVVPRKHVTDAMAHPLAASRAMHFAAVLAGLMELGACNFITSAGAAATQTVMHLHVHVVPRREGDGLTLPWTGQHQPPKRDPTGTTAGQFGLGPIRAPFRRDARPPRPEVPFGFAPACLGGATEAEDYRDEKWRDAAS